MTIRHLKDLILEHRHDAKTKYIQLTSKIEYIDAESDQVRELFGMITAYNDILELIDSYEDDYLKLLKNKVEQDDKNERCLIIYDIINKWKNHAYLVTSKNRKGEEKYDFTLKDICKYDCELLGGLLFNEEE